MKIILPLVIIGLVLVGGIVYFNNRSNESFSPTESATPARTEVTPVDDNTSNNGVGAYISYSSSVIASTVGTKILFFHAPWCPQCRALDASIKSGEIPTGVTLIKVDYDTNQALRQKYGVTIQTTLVKVDDDGNLVKKYVAYDEPTLVSVKNNLL